MALLSACESKTVSGVGRGELVWSDEFDGAALDPNNWRPEVTCTVYNSEEQCYTASPNNIRIEAGNLVLSALKQGGLAHPYSSGRINTLGRRAQAYGTFESRIKVPCGQGVWPAFWLMPSGDPYGAWPRSGELDIMEFLGKDPGTIYGTAHFGELQGGSHPMHHGSHVIDPGRYCDDFHVFALEWTPTSITWWVDDVSYLTLTSTEKSWAPLDHWPFDKPFYVILNLAIGGSWGGPPDPSLTSAQMLVDYVRVYTQP